MDLNTKAQASINKTLIQVLHFTIPNYLLCIDITYIKQLIDLVSLQKVPGTPPYFKGLMNYHGQEIPVIDLADYLDITTSNHSDLNRKIILCDEGRHKLGLIVNEIVGLEKVATESIQAQQLLQHDFATFLKGSIITDRNESLILDIEKIITHICSKEQNNEKQPSR
jgi:purine-binding chemotaxis protein CheW